MAGGKYKTILHLDRERLCALFIEMVLNLETATEEGKKTMQEES